MNASKTWVSVCVLVVGLVGVASAITIDTVTVGNRGNAADTQVMNDGTSGYGSVGSTYKIGKYEVTTSQYCAFLNAVAKTDTYALYNTSMASTTYGCRIARTGSSGSYVYSVVSGYENRPVNYVSWGDAARFANWLHNGQLTGTQSLSTTEDGSYYLNGATTATALMAVTRKANATWVIPKENQWYKAAFHDPNHDGPGIPGYWDYPTGTDAVPGRDTSELTKPGNNANWWVTPLTPYPIDGTCYYTIAGKFASSDSPYGTFDQGGNVWEWNEAVVTATARGLRGGSYNRDVDRLHAQYRFSQDLSAAEGSNVGFRVAYPEPAAAVLLLTGGLVVLGRGRQRR